MASGVRAAQWQLPPIFNSSWPQGPPSLNGMGSEGGAKEGERGGEGKRREKGKTQATSDEPQLSLSLTLFFSFCGKDE